MLFENNKLCLPMQDIFSHDEYLLPSRANSCHTFIGRFHAHTFSRELDGGFVKTSALVKQGNKVWQKIISRTFVNFLILKAKG
jgi:hypothetical protein